VLASVGCNQIIGIDQLHDDRICRGTRATVCAHPLRGDIELSPGTFDTDTDPRCETSTQPLGNPDVCVVAARDITIVGQVETTGSRPFVVLATRSILVQTGAVLDASSHRDGLPGPGASSVLCSSMMVPGPSGGGAGGSFGGTGGNGGNGGGMQSHGIAAAALPISTLTGIRGSCAGDPGGLSTGTPGAAGGASGGAVYLLAETSIDVTVTSVIVASGAGGEGGAVGGGGGGGGAGGLVALEAPAITIGGQIVAHGGAGGAGGGLAVAGAPGGDGAATFADKSTTVLGTGGGGDGGRGSFGTMPNGVAGTGGTSGASGGGGGGGQGMIFTLGTLIAAPTQVTPAPIAL
jgi:hypothetical protein